MKLTDLDPRWLIVNGTRVGFVFLSPTVKVRTAVDHPGTIWRQSCFVANTPRRAQADLFEAMFGEDDYSVQFCDPTCAWKVKGGIENASFETMTVTPSLDGSKGGLWHGFITNGEIT